MFELNDNKLFDDIIIKFTIIDTSMLIDEPSSIKKIGIKKLDISKVVNEIGQYKRTTGVMVGEFEIAENIFLYFFIFDDTILILEKNNLNQLQPFLSKGRNFQLHFLRRYFVSFEEYLSNLPNENPNQTNQVKFSKLKIIQNMKNQIFKGIVLKSKNRSCLLEEYNQLPEYKFQDFISIYDFKRSFKNCSVSLCFNVNDQLLYVLKKFNKFEMDSQFNHELNFYKLVQNKNEHVSKYFGTFETKESNFIVIEYVQGDTLLKFMKNNQNKISLFDKIRIIIEILFAVESSHLNKIVLRDIKSDNIIMNINQEPILIDFDQTKSVDSKYEENYEMTGDIGSVYFSAPEQYLTNEYSFKADIYSIGMIIHYILTEKPFNYDILSLINKFKETKGNILDLKGGLKCDEKYQKINKIYKKCLEYQPEKRPNISQILNEFLIEFHDFLMSHPKSFYIACLVDFRENIFNDILKSSEDKEKEFFPDISSFYGLIYFKNLYDKKDFKKALSYFEISSKQNPNSNNPNVSRSQYYLGLIYYSGINLPIDMGKSIYYLTISANHGNEDAQYLIGMIYLKGKKINKNISKAINYLTLAANQNHPKAQSILAAIYSNNEITKKDINKTIHYLKLAADQNVAVSQYLLGKYYYEGKDVEKNIDKSIDYLTKAANNGHPMAMLLLGKIYYEGKYVKRDMNKAFQYLNASANKNEKDAQYLLGLIYYEGQFVHRDINKSINYLTLSANQNNSKAQYLLGEIFYLGKYIKIDIDKSIYYLALSANQNDNHAQYLLGLIYFEDKYIERNIYKALNYFALSANQNNSRAQFYLGFIFYKGISVNININNAINYLSLSANQNDRDAQYFLGEIFYEGKFVQRNTNKSIHYLTLSSNQNNSQAQYLLGAIFYEAKDVPQDVNKAIHYLTLSSNQNNSDAQCLLGEIYCHCKSIQKDINKAIYYLTLSSNQDNSNAQFYLGMIYLDDKYGKKDIKKAFYYINLSADHKDNEAQFFLGMLYFNGKYIQRDINKSIFYLTLSANQNNSDAQSFLGKILYEGEFVPKNINKAIYYLTLAAESNNKDSQFLLSEIYYKGEFVKKDIQKVIHYLKELSSFNNNMAKNNLGVIYKNGDGVDKNIFNAIEYFEEGIRLKNDTFSIFNLARIFYFGIDVEKDLKKAIQLLENTSSDDFYPINLFLFFIYNYGDLSVLNKTKANYYQSKFINEFDNDSFIKSFIGIKYDKSEFDSIIARRMKIFFEKYDLVYKTDLDFAKDFLVFMITESFTCEKEFNEANETYRRKNLKDIDQHFYEGFNN